MTELSTLNDATPHVGPRVATAFLPGPVLVPISAVSTPAPIASALSESGKTRGVAVDAPAIRWTSKAPRAVLILVSIKFSPVVGSDKLRAHIYKNGAPIPGASFSVQADAVPKDVTVHTGVELALNDTVSIWISNEETSQDVSIEEMLLTVFG